MNIVEALTSPPMKTEAQLLREQIARLEKELAEQYNKTAEKQAEIAELKAARERQKQQAFDYADTNIALRTQLAAANQEIAALKGNTEPVAWCYYDDDGALCFSDDVPGAVPLYLHPAPPVSDEPVAWMVTIKNTDGYESYAMTTEEGAKAFASEFRDPYITPLFTHPTPNASAEMERDAARWRYAAKHLRQWELSIKTYPDMGLTNLVDAAIDAAMQGKDE